MYKQHNSITTNRQKTTYVSIPEDAARDGMKAAGMHDWFINSMTELYGIIIMSKLCIRFIISGRKDYRKETYIFRSVCQRLCRGF